MILEDLVMLGTTVPEPNSDGRVFVCSAGVSQEYGKLVRIYPLARRGVPKRWGMYRVPLVRNPKDSRDESFQIAAARDRGPHEQINRHFELVKAQVPESQRLRLLAPYVVGSIQEANDRSRSAKTPRERMSLAILHPDSMSLHFDTNPDAPDAPQQALFDRPGEPPSGARRFPLMPRIQFRDELGWHDLMLRDWGTFELQRKNSQAYFRQNLESALHLRADSSLLVGNMNNRRGNWLVISVLNGIREAPTLFDAWNSDRNTLSDRVRREVFNRDRWRCVNCGQAAGLAVDHIWPKARGGSDSLRNLQTLCRECNAAKGDRADGARDLG